MVCKGRSLLITVSLAPSRKLTYNRTQQAVLSEPETRKAAGTQEAAMGVRLSPDMVGSYGRRLPSRGEGRVHLRSLRPQQEQCI